MLNPSLILITLSFLLSVILSSLMIAFIITSTDKFHSFDRENCAEGGFFHGLGLMPPPGEMCEYGDTHKLQA
jgi:hypothetical protein